MLLKISRARGPYLLETDTHRSRSLDPFRYLRGAGSRSPITEPGLARDHHDIQEGQKWSWTCKLS